MKLPDCDLCDTEQSELGALLFGPPDPQGYARKHHVCSKCYERILDTWEGS